MFDAGPTARIYMHDIASRNVRLLHREFAGFVHVPGLVHSEVTAAWLQAIREGRLTWDVYRQFLAAFEIDLAEGIVRAWNDDDLVPGVLAVQEEITRRHVANPSITPILHTHDAYYVALAVALTAETGQRTVLVTNDARVWRGARLLGVEVFHGNTCDLGVGRLHVGNPGAHFPEGANCRPCQHPTCPSGFLIDLIGLPRDLESGDPRTQRERASWPVGAARPPEPR